MRASSDYYVLFEHNGQPITRRWMPYVIHPPDEVILDDQVWQVIKTTWTPGNDCHYVLTVEPVSSLLPDWVAGLTAIGRKSS